MKIFRSAPGTHIFSLFTAIIFLNMSFFLAEVCMLEITDDDMIENVCNLVLNGGLEEERDGHSTGSDVPVNDFSHGGGHLLMRHSSLFVIGARSHQEDQDHYLHADHSQIFSPPPEYPFFGS